MPSLSKGLNERGTLEELLNAGWEMVGMLYDICLYENITLEEARYELRELGIDPDEVELMEIEEGGFKGE